MRYRKDKNGNDLSVLGFGCMRFQTNMGKIDMQKAEKQIMTAINSGVNSQLSKTPTSRQVPATFCCKVNTASGSKVAGLFLSTTEKFV